MDPRKLLYFATIVENGSFKKAAKQLAISQPALSTSMDRLEQSLGEQLLHRTPTGVTPTSVGELLYAHARFIRDELELAAKRVRGVDPLGSNALAFGTLPSLATSIIPKAVCQWRSKHIGHTLRVVEKIQIELLLSLMRGELEFIIAQTESYGYVDGLMQRVLFRDRLHVIGRHEHPALRLEKPTWKDLATFPWIIQMIARQRTLLERLLTTEGAEWPAQVTECGSVACIKSLVTASDSLAMLPASAVSTDVREGRIGVLDITGPLLHRDIAVMFRERLPISDAGRELVEQIAAAGASLGQEDFSAQRASAAA